MTKTIFYTLFTTLALGLTFLFVSTPVAHAASECGGVETSIIKCKSTGKETDVKETAIWEVLKIAVNIMTGGVAILALGGFIYGTFLYTSSGGNAETKKKAITVITNVFIGIVAYALMYAILTFILPGGVDF